MPTKIQKNQIATTLIDGWTPADATWTYASASTITVPSGAASIYQKGDRIKWTQTTVKYGVIVAVADTLLTIAVNTDYTVANAAISANYYSHQANPLGYPGSFACSPTMTNITLGSGTRVSRYYIIGDRLFMDFKFTYGSGSAVGTNPTIAAPVAALAGNFIEVGVASTWDNSATTRHIGGCMVLTTEIYPFHYTSTGYGYYGANIPFTWATDDFFNFHISYRI